METALENGTSKILWDFSIFVVVLLFLGMVMYDNEFQTKENKN